jgi:hypothetical protein
MTRPSPRRRLETGRLAVGKAGEQRITATAARCFAIMRQEKDWEITQMPEIQIGLRGRLTGDGAIQRPWWAASTSALSTHMFET